MTINITNRIGQHKIPQRITQKQNTLTFLTTRVRAWPVPHSAADVNDWFFYLVVGVGIKQKQDAATQDIQRNERAKLWIFRTNCEMETVATCSTTDGNGSYHGLAPSFFE